MCRSGLRAAGTAMHLLARHLGVFHAESIADHCHICALKHAPDCAELNRDPSTDVWQLLAALDIVPTAE